MIDEYHQDKSLAAKYNIDEFPTLEFFKNQIPSVYDGELEKPGEVLTWINDLLTGADIEQVWWCFGFLHKNILLFVSLYLLWISSDYQRHT